MSTRDPILSAIGEKLREDDPLADDRWDALVEGRLGPAETEALRAAVERGEAPAVAFEALQPLDDGERESIVDAMFAARANAGPPPAPEAAPDAPIPIDRARRSRFRSFSRVLTGLAVAAGLAIILGPTVMTRLTSVESLPGYTIVTGGGESGDSRLRTPRTGVPITLGPGARLDLVIRAVDGAVAGTVEAAVFTQVNGVLSRAAVVAQPTEHSSFSVKVTREDLIPAAANGEAAVAMLLVVVVARPGRMPDTATVRRIVAGDKSDEGTGAPFHVLSQALKLVSR